MRLDTTVLFLHGCIAFYNLVWWVQARAASLQSCVIIIRIMRDLCRRIPNWTPLDPYVSVLLVIMNIAWHS